MKRIICTILAVLFIMMSVIGFADEGKLTLTISEAQEQALKNSRQSMADDLDIKMKESVLKKAIEDASFLTFAGTPEKMLSNRITAEVVPLEEETKLEIAKKNKEIHTKELSLNVFAAALEILLIEKELSIVNTKLQNMNEKLEMVKSQKEVGRATESDVSNAEYMLGNKKIDVMKVEEKHKAAVLEFKKLLNKPLDLSGIEINAFIPYADLGEFDFENALIEAIGTDVGVYEKEQAVKAKEKSLQIAGEIYKEGQSNYDQAAYDLESAKIALDDKKINLEVEIRNKYNDLLNKRDTVELTKVYRSIASQYQDAAKLKFELGVISKEELMNEEEKYLDSTYQEYSAAKDYSVSKAEFLRLLNK